ncbi:MAG: hypothetical protein AAFS10_16820 [Myxococcota bacterium]
MDDPHRHPSAEPHTHTDCGHDHGPPAQHDHLPPSNATAIVLLAASNGARRGALTRLRPPYGASDLPKPERALDRMRRVLNPKAPWTRWIVVSDRGEAGEPVRRATAPWASPVLCTTEGPQPSAACGLGPGDNTSHALRAGLRVAFQTSQPPQAALVWSADRPLTSTAALTRLLTCGTAQLTRPHLPWVRILTRQGDLSAIGQPAIISQQAAHHLIETHTDLPEAIASGALLVQRVLTPEPWPWTVIQSQADSAPFAG